MSSMTKEQIEYTVRHSGLINMRAFQVTVVVLDTVGFALFLGRVIVRSTQQRKPGVDDIILFFGVLCLAAATGVLFHYMRIFYVHAAQVLHPEILPFTLNYLPQLMKINVAIYSYLALIWTTTFAVKACFLAFFKVLINSGSRRLRRYYWFVVIFTGLTWCFLIPEPFIVCPYFGLDAIKCFPKTPRKLTFGLTTTITILDVLSDIFIITIPIIVLRHAQLRFSTKLGLYFFLCLSFFMVVCAITRCAGYYQGGKEDVMYSFFWQQMEGNIAIIMASITVMRTLFTPRHTLEETRQSPQHSNPVLRMIQFLSGSNRRAADLSGSTAVVQEESQENNNSNSMARGTFLKIKFPSPILKTMRSMVGITALSNTRMTTYGYGSGSELDLIDTDYHTTLRPHRQPERSG